MILGKANKSKILALILGLTMCLALMLGIVFASPTSTARAEETDTRIPVKTITAISNVDDIIGFRKSVVRPSFNIEGDVPALFSTSGDWQRKTATGDWAYYSGTAFIEGTYRYKTQIRIEGAAGTTHVLDKNGITVTVNDVKWAEKSFPTIYDTYSYDWVYSKEYEVTAPAGTPLDFIKDNKWDIDSTYINQAITAFSVADGAVGGTKPYAFSKASGPSWLEVAADGTVSGTPTALGANADLVIKVTDSAAEPASKEITLDVGNTYVFPADREVISVIRATSNIGEIIGYEKSVAKPSFTFTEGTQAKFSQGMGGWFKKEGTAWKRYEEATFTEGTYMYNDQLRVDDEAGRTHVLNKDGVFVYIDGELRADNQKPDAIYDTYSYIYVNTIDYKVVKPTTVAITDELVPVTDLEKVFNEAAQEPTFGGTLVRGTDYEVSYAVKGTAGGLDFSKKPVDAGTYIVTVTGKGAYEGSFTKEFVINKAEQTVVPVGLIANPISCREGSGTIDGVTDAMEYRKVGDADYTKCTSSTITGLAAGEYLIRYAENNNYLASDDVTVTIAISHNLGTLNEEIPATCIADGMKAHYYCSDCGKFFDESKKETTEAALTIPAIGVHTFGTLIDETPATCIAGGMKAHYKCTVCGKYFDADKNETTEEALKTPISPYYGHNFGPWVEEEYATCQAPGRKGYKHCSICNKYYDASNTEITDFVIPVNPEGHELGALVAEVPATCKEPGEKAHRDCNLCGKHCDPITRKEITDLTIPTTNNHTYGELIPEVPATADKTGTKKHYKCSVCGKLFDENKNEVTAAELVIPKIGTHTVTVNGGTGGGVFIQGASVTITADAPMTGKRFTGWTIEGISGLDTTKTSITFNMPANNVTATANYEDIEYTVNVIGGTTNKAKAKYGESVTITANAPGVGGRFAAWTLRGVSVADTTKTEITFNMPAGNVTAFANYANIGYTITVKDGTADKSEAIYGASVTITANAPMTGKRFTGWTIEGISGLDTTKTSITFNMPANNVTATANYEDIEYTVTVNDGTANKAKAIYGESVTITANAPMTGKRFTGWTIEGISGLDITKTSITFNMPANKVTATANYEDIEYTVTVNGGTTNKAKAIYGETVTITANPAPTGKVFDKWTCETAGVTIEFASATSSPTTFEMPAANVKIQAHFRNIEAAPSIEIKVEGGTGAGTYKEGDEVTVTAEDKDGKIFKGWKDESGKIVSAEKAYTFTVSEEKTLTAVYEDKTSGGAIAGIVIGSVAVAGIGGFAIFWFAVKKKTFADLGIALKKGFTAMGNGIKTACRAIGNFFKNLGAKIKALFTKKK